ncbi:MAG: hypothetical protein K0Q72_647 [Armatimonadetes bacterium]|jgi:hypothetical protein|nr:hypothetical protein [Armatimonadota bacterium]
MEAADAAEQIREQLGGEHTEAERFRARAALLIAVLAMLLAVTSLGGGNVTEDMLTANIQTSDAWAFYQAKNVRQTVNELAADQLELELLRTPEMPAKARQGYEARIREYRGRVARYESEPDPEAPDDPTRGDGKKQLSARAKTLEQQRERAQKQDPNFDFAEALFQIAIVLGSVAILATSRPVLALSLAMGAVATVLMLNGYFLFMHLF